MIRENEQLIRALETDRIVAAAIEVLNRPIMQQSSWMADGSGAAGVSGYLGASAMTPLDRRAEAAMLMAKVDRLPPLQRLIVRAVHDRAARVPAILALAKVCNAGPEAARREYVAKWLGEEEMVWRRGCDQTFATYRRQFGGSEATHCRTFATWTDVLARLYRAGLTNLERLLVGAEASPWVECDIERIGTDEDADRAR